METDCERRFVYTQVTLSLPDSGDLSPSTVSLVSTDLWTGTRVPLKRSVLPDRVSRVPNSKLSWPDEGRPDLSPGCPLPYTTIGVPPPLSFRV